SRYFIKPVLWDPEDPYGPWLLMEYAERGSLTERLEEVEHQRLEALRKPLVHERPEVERLPLRSLPYPEAYGHICQTARGVDAAHDIGIVLRDVKPGNLLLCADGSVRLSDQGIASRLRDADDTLPPPYTPRYASPELVIVRRAKQAGLAPPEELLTFEVEKGNDRYAASTVGYQELAGHTPFSSDADERLDHAPPDPREF